MVIKNLTFKIKFKLFKAIPIIVVEQSKHLIKLFCIMASYTQCGYAGLY